MKKRIIFDFLTIIIVITSYMACGLTNSRESNFIGNWVEESHAGSLDFLGMKIEVTDSTYIIEITKQGANYMVRNKIHRDGGFEGIYTLTKDNNLSGLNGMVTIVYDDKSGSLLISAWGEPIENWIRLVGK